MITKRKALFTGMLFLLLFTTACGGAAPATQAPAAIPPAANYEPEIPAAATEAPAAKPSSLASPLWQLNLPIPPNPTRLCSPPGAAPMICSSKTMGSIPSIDTEDDQPFHFCAGCGYRFVYRHAQLFERWQPAAQRFRARGRVCQLL